MVVDAIVLCGGNTKGLEAEQVSAKGLAKINQKSMIVYVVDALRKSSAVSRIVVVAPPGIEYESWASRVEEVLPTRGSLTQNMQVGFEYLKDDKPLLVLSCDIPFITPESIDDFINRCQKREAEIYYPVISRESAEAHFPGAKRTYVTLKEGVFTGGNLALIYPRIIEENIELVEKVYGLRKTPRQLLRILGLKFILKFLFHQLTISEIESRCSDLLKAKACAIITPYPQIGMDIDKSSDLELARKILQGPEKETKTVIITEEAPLPLGPYVQAVKMGRLIFVSGQISIDPTTGEIIQGTAKEQTALIFKNIKAILEAGDSALSKVLKASVFLRNLDDFKEVNAIFEEVFKENPPARETVEVSRLPGDVKVEISVIALAD